MSRSIRLLAAAALLAAPMVIGVAAPAGARSAAPTFTVFRSGVVALPNSNVKGKGAKLKFAPAKLTAAWSGPPPVKKCTKKKEDLTITNPTKNAVTVTNPSDGSTFATIPGQSVLGVCGWGTGTATATLGLQGSTNILTIKFGVP